MKEWICEEVPAITIDGKPISTMLHQKQELVRCKDCRNGCIDSTSYPHYWCSAHTEYHDGVFFCADGERKE